MYSSPSKRLWRRVMASVGCLTLSGTAGYFLYLDLTGTASQHTGPIIASVTRSVSRVRRKPKSSFLWEAAKTGAQLAKRDSLQVGEASAATVTLKNDTVLEIGEHSLVIIDDVPPLEMQFLKGSFVVRGKDKDYLIEADENKAPVIRAIPIRLLSPGARQALFVKGAKETDVLFEWLDLGKASTGTTNLNARLEISTSSRFTVTKTKSFPIESGKSMQTVPLAVGSYYWRIASANTPDPDVRRFQVRRAQALVPLWPPDGKTVQQWGEQSTSEFRWKSSTNTFPAEPRLQIATAPSFAPDTLRVNTAVNPETGRYVTGDLRTGTYYWRMHSPYPQFAVNSPTRTLNIVSASDLKLTLVSPTPGAPLPIEKPIDFSWRFAAEGTSFELQLDRFMSASETVEVERLRSKQQRVEWKPTTPGRYQWRVVALHNNAPITETPWQDLQIIDERPIAIVSPADNAAYFYWKELPEFALEWQEIGESRESAVQVIVAADPTLKVRAKTFRPTERFIRRETMNLEDGNYYWAVHLVDGAGNIVRKSAVQKFTVAVHPPLQAPREVYPKNNQSINIVQMQKDPALRWERVPEATEYEVKLLDAGGRELASTTTESTSYPLKEIKQGKYRWTVRAIDPLKRPGKSLGNRRFTIEYGAQLNAPEILGSKVE